MTGIKVMLYAIALLLVLVITWAVQDSRIGWGYTLITVGVLAVYFVAITAIRKSMHK
jgi:hypothetical protein